MDPAYIQNLHTLLAQTVAPDTNIIKAATAALNKDYYKDPSCIPALFEIIATSPDQNVRQLAAVELRKRISQGDGKLWLALPQEMRETIKVKILETIVNESVSLVKHSTARVISAVANIELLAENWAALLPFLQQSTSSPTASHREVGSFVLYSVMESVIEALKQQSSALFPMLSHLLVDPESMEVRITAVRALGTLAQYIEAEDKADIKSFQGLIPGILNVIAQAAEADNDDSARYGFDVLETLLILETPLLAKNIPDLVQFCLTIGANQGTSDEIRQMALNCLNWTIKYKKTKIQALNLAKPILEALLPIGAEADPEDNDEDSPSRLAFRAVDALATVLPPTQVFPPLHQLVTGYMQSPEPGLRKAAMMAFGVTVEGCSEFIRPHMKSLWPLLDAGFSDNHPVVKKAACIAFACVCEWLEEECVERHAVLLPAILELANDPESQGPACTALDAYLEIMESEIGNYLVQIMTKLVNLLDHAPISVKAIVTGAIGSAAHASKQNFQPYFEATMQRLEPFLALNKEGEEQDLRGITTDAIGTIAEAVGKDMFRPYFGPMMERAFEGIHLGSARLKECSFLFFGVMAKVFESEFKVYLPRVVPPLIESLKQSEGGDDLLSQFVQQATETFGTGESSTSAIQITEGDTDVLDLDPAAQISVNSAIAIEKEIAADTMGTIFEYTRADFLPYLEQCTLQLVDALGHYYEGIRKSAVTSLLEFVKTFYELSESPLWEPGAEPKVPLHEKVKELVDAVLPPLFNMWESEDDKGVVSQLCQNLAETLSKVGPALLQGGHLNTVCEHVKQILEGKSLCQQDPDAEEGDEVLEDQAEFDSVLISAASDLIATLATVLGPDFVQVFGTFLPLIAKYTAKHRSNTDRASAIGTIGEIITGMKGGITQFTEPVLELTFVALSDEDPEVRSNAAFACGVLIENSDQDVSAQYMHLLGALRPLFDVTPNSSQAEMHARDNAAGAVSRMIVKNSAALPLEQILPVLFGALPLKNDYLENTPLYRAIFHLFQTNPQIIMPHVDLLLPAFAIVLDPNGEDQLISEFRGDLVSLIGALNGQIPDKIAASGLTAYL